VGQEQSAQTQLAHASPPQPSQLQVLWLQVAHVQSEQEHCAQLSEQLAQEQVVHSS
jgi:hypothetical protein